MEIAPRIFSSKGGTIALGVAAALIAAIAVFVYVHNYRQTVQKGGTPATVLVAKSLIPKGTLGSAIAQNGLFQAATIRESQLRDGAISDPVSLRGRVAAADIYPGQQLTTADFSAGVRGIVGQLTGADRAITIPIDAAHGMLGAVRAGDHVDIYAGFNVSPVSGTGPPKTILRLIMQDIHVLGVGTAGGSGLGSSSSAQVTLRATATQAAQLAFASDNGKLWLDLRPAYGAAPSPPSAVSVETLMLGVPPQVILHALGGR